MNISSGESVGGFFDNKYLIGIIMVIINLGARFIVNELNEDQRNMINSKYLRRILIFLVIFMATRDIVITIILSVVVILFVLTPSPTTISCSISLKILPNTLTKLVKEGAVLSTLLLCKIQAETYSYHFVGVIFLYHHYY